MSLPFELSLYTLADLASLFAGDASALLEGLRNFKCRRFPRDENESEAHDESYSMDNDPMR